MVRRSREVVTTVIANSVRSTNLRAMVLGVARSARIMATTTASATLLVATTVGATVAAVETVRPTPPTHMEQIPTGILTPARLTT